MLEEQATTMASLVVGLTPPQAEHRYAPGKWSVKQVLAHLADTERVFTFRALWFARGETMALPGMDENQRGQTAGADARAVADIGRELAGLRQLSLGLFALLHRPRPGSAAAWRASGCSACAPCPGSLPGTNAITWRSCGSGTIGGGCSTSRREPPRAARQQECDDGQRRNRGPQQGPIAGLKNRLGADLFGVADHHGEREPVVQGVRDHRREQAACRLVEVGEDQAETDQPEEEPGFAVDQPEEQGRHQGRGPGPQVRRARR